MRFAIWQSSGKGVHLHRQLVAAGHTPAAKVSDTDVMILDCDWRWAAPRPELISEAVQAGAKIALFPHGGLPLSWIYDGLTEPDPRVDVRLEHGYGSIRAADLLGLNLKQKACGWLFSKTRPFQPVLEPRRVLFAPQHPNMEVLNQARANGNDCGPALNQKVYKELLETGYQIMVSMVGPAWRNGLWAHPNATFVENPEMRYEQTWKLLETADVVVAAGSTAAASVAAGRPTVMFGQESYFDYIDGKYRNADHPDVYRDLFRYPIDVDQGLEQAIQTACEGSEMAAIWRELHVGTDGTGKAVRFLEDLAGVVSSSVDAMIGGVTAKVSLKGV